MNLTDQETLELNELCSALVDGGLTETQRVRLNRLLRDSEAARQFYIRYAGLSASLIGYAGEMQSEQPDLVPRRKRGAWWIATLVASAAAVVAAAVTLWLSGSGGAGTGHEIAEQEDDAFVARLTGARDCEWRGRAVALNVGDHLRSGERLELAKGAAEITFDTGAQVMLEANTEFEVNSAWNATLHHGTLRATAPLQAVGFRVAGPTVDVVDLGTDFSMVAERGKMTEVYVLKGSVEATPRDDGGVRQQSVVLQELQARRFGYREASEIHDKEQKIQRFRQRAELDRRTPPGSWVHWSFDEAGGAKARAEVRGRSEQVLDLTFEPEDGMALGHAGHLGSCLSLKGTSWGKVALAGISSSVPRTVAFWVKVPADADLSEASVLVSWGGLKGGSDPVQIGWNRNPAQGVLGAIRTEIGKRSVVGSTPLRDGTWHHVAVVLVPVLGEEPSLQVKQYIDGRLEGGSGKRLKKYRFTQGTESEGSGGDVLRIGDRVPSVRQGHAFFRGELDELFIVDGAVSPREILQLMVENRLPRSGGQP